MARTWNLQRPIMLMSITLLPWTACTCEDESALPEWELLEPGAPTTTPAPADLPDDLAQDQDASEDLPDDIATDVVEDLPDAPLDAPDQPQTPIDLPPDVPWTPEVVEEVSREQALTERSSLSVSDDGTVWLGYHSCADTQCSDPRLTVAIQQRASTMWAKESIARQRGTFGLSVYNNAPFVAYLDDINQQFRVSRRTSAGLWPPEALPVTYTGVSDGLDLTQDSTNLYVTFANNNGDPVSLFTMNMTQPQLAWRELRSLDVGRAHAALERGLQADGQGNLYLVHRDGELGPYGVARYRLRDNLWDRRTYYADPSLIVSSMVARDSGDICMSSGDNQYINPRLTLTCGRISRLERDAWVLEGEPISSYSSLIEGRDGSLIIAYNYGNNERLKVARRYPDGTWDVRTAFDGPSYGVSTAIDPDNKLLISYYTCRQNRCTLEFLRQPY